MTFIDWFAGNGVTVNVIEAIARRLKHEHTNTTREDPVVHE